MSIVDIHTAMFIHILYQARAQSTRLILLVLTNAKRAVLQAPLSRLYNRSWTIRCLSNSCLLRIEFTNTDALDLLQKPAADSWRTSSPRSSSAFSGNRARNGQLYECNRRDTSRSVPHISIQITFLLSPVCGPFRVHFIPIFNLDCTNRTRVARTCLFSCVLGSLLLFTSISMAIFTPALGRLPAVRVPLCNY